jgi:hypothetical protein
MKKVLQVGIYFQRREDFGTSAASGSIRTGGPK